MKKKLSTIILTNFKIATLIILDGFILVMTSLVGDSGLMFMGAIVWVLGQWIFIIWSIQNKPPSRLKLFILRLNWFHWLLLFISYIYIQDWIIVFIYSRFGEEWFQWL
jgi:hypothetical protein